MRGQQQPQMVRGRGGMQVRGGGMQVRGGQQPQMRGGMQGMRGTPQQRMIRPAMAGQGGVRRGRPPGQLNNTAQQLQNQQYTNAALGIKPKPRQRAPAMQSMSGYQTQSMPAQNFTPRPIRPAAPQIIALPPAEIQSGGSSWHTPSQVGSSGGVSPPSSDITSFKIKLPSITKKNDAPNGNIMAGVDPLAADPVTVVKTEKRAGVPSAPVHNPIQTPDFGMIVDDEISIVPERQKENAASKNNTDVSSVKLEGRKGAGGQSKKPEGDWCAICHDGGDTLYCCDRCPKVYHMNCYVPPLPGEPADDWVCLLCTSIDEILSLPTKVRKGRGRLSERDLKLCRRLLLEMYNMWPESVPFRDCGDLNFPAYLEKIKEPIALDVIKERLDEENPDQYTSVRNFLSDLRKMFRNCFTFNNRESEIYKHARKLEGKLDQLLQIWAPEFVGDPLIDLATLQKAAKRPGSPSGSKKDRKRRKRKMSGDEDDDGDEGSEVMTEQEREKQQYLAALHASMKQGGDPGDEDFDPSEEKKGKRGRRSKR